jgi:hypothetical protein
MADFAGIYEAKAVSTLDGDILVVIPQVWGEESVPLAGSAGMQPSIGSKGYVSFISGEREYPVWMGDETSVYCF